MIDRTLLTELNHLWDPVQPYLATQVEELYGRRDGQVLEIGPFAGLIYLLCRKGVGERFLLAAFPLETALSFQQEGERLKLSDRVGIIASSSSLSGVPDDSVDLAIFRGALFFPSLFQVDFGAIDRVLRKGGTAFVGGGFGKYTPPDVVSRIGRRSEELNRALGRVRLTMENVQEMLGKANLKARAEITTDGGLWVVMKK